MEFITENGEKEVKLETASFKDASNLRKALVKCLKSEGIISGNDVSNMMNVDIGSLINLLVNIDSSDEFEKAVMDCLKSCIYDYRGKNIKITPQLFDDIPEAREDYYQIITKCCEVNLAPFFKSLGTELKMRLGTLTSDTPEQP